MLKTNKEKNVRRVFVVTVAEVERLELKQNCPNCNLSICDVRKV